MFELTIRDPNSLLSVIVRADITDEQVEQIRQIVHPDGPADHTPSPSEPSDALDRGLGRLPYM